MASLSPSTTTTTHTLSAVPRNPLLSKSSQLSAYRSTQTRRPPVKISCKATNNDESNKFDRRNLLIGLGGLYGASTTLIGGNATLAAPTAPDTTQCVLSTITGDDPNAPSITLNCCPPKPSDFVDFKKPKVQHHKLRLRPAVHLVDDEYLEKYSKALALMKACLIVTLVALSNKLMCIVLIVMGVTIKSGYPMSNIRSMDLGYFSPFIGLTFISMKES
ncbi:hypothetical protein BVRB_8g183880 [Beta vulgaris subsp. vulgaris]|nr:hypothetical protein BVRB_8g183880 [Beta vulgaris subsp. vulgaris]